ncbi:hypothetical protein LOTGIDRAFT_168954 [Lottia gigantea]|uniref:Uncharacterized protein n=1 Tax=Lottia gigantea TaxID=225164 RepID=V3ZI87_LOTGI|nr:hypothetical protein LOTGIDRAFT_168954 [Lottia gigantea]ESO83912.1 hypothetical protein LOTGIDRAFT_168954 [Lottia gigantea]
MMMESSINSATILPPYEEEFETVDNLHWSPETANSIYLFWIHQLQASNLVSNKRARWRKRVRDNKPAFPPMNPSYIPPVAANIPQYNMMSPSALMSQVIPSSVASRPVYNIPSSIPAPSNNATFQRTMSFPTYVNSYMYPQFR